MPVGGSRRVLRFEAFALDLSRCTLRRGSEELPLRPKSFDVLRYLAEHPSRVVSKAELFEAVWPQVSVTDDSLVQCIKEVRQALGDSERLLLRTVAKRGYVLDARVAQDDDPGRPADAGPKVASELPAETSGGSLASATQRSFWRAGIIARWRRPALVVAVAIILIAASAGALVALRPPMPNDNAAHHAILATALLDKESSRPIIREAIIHYNKALALDPGNVLALVGYARALVTDVSEGWVPSQERSARLAQAEVALQRALSIAPDDAGAHHITGLLWRVRGDPDRAIPALEQALRLAPTKAWARAALGRAKLEAGLAREAINDLEIAMRLAPDEPTIYIWYFQAGMAAVHAADGETALGWFRKSEEASQAYHRHIMLWRAVALADLGRDEEARALIARHLADAPEATVANWRRYFPGRNAMVAAQRTRIAESSEPARCSPWRHQRRLGAMNAALP